MMIEVRIRRSDEAGSRHLCTWPASELDNLLPMVKAWGVFDHHGTVVRHTHLRGTMGLLHDGGAQSNMKAGLAKLRRVAATGKPWVRTPNPPRFSLDDVQAAVTG